MPKISILVAVYNSSAYLPQCLDSLLGQTLHDIEVLCVDDSSTDNSLAILRDYAERDTRVKVFALDENHGIAFARNVALSNASGEFICFVDSDDWLAPNALEAVYKTFTDDVDSVLFQVVLHYADGREKTYPMPPFEALSGERAFVDSLTWKIHGVYAIRAAIHHAYPYDDALRTYSDENITRIHYLKSRKVAVCEGVYYYRQHTSSTTHRVSVRRFDYLLANERMRCQLVAMGTSEANLRCYETIRWQNLVGLYLFYYLHRHELSSTDRQEALSIMRHVWQTIHLQQVSPSLRRKFGYIPFRPSQPSHRSSWSSHRSSLSTLCCRTWLPLRSSWFLFRLQEELYFTLRALVGRNKEAE